MMNISRNIVLVGMIGSCIMLCVEAVVIVDRVTFVLCQCIVIDVVHKFICFGSRYIIINGLSCFAYSSCKY